MSSTELNPQAVCVAIVSPDSTKDVNDETSAKEAAESLTDMIVDMLLALFMRDEEPCPPCLGKPYTGEGVENTNCRVCNWTVACDKQALENYQTH